MLLPVNPLAAQEAFAVQDPLDCDEAVVDTSGAVDVDLVRSALDLIDPQATLVVRSFDQVPNADLVAAIDEIVVSCYGDETLGVRSEVIVLGLSVGDRLSDVLVGARWGAAVSDPDGLRADVMGTRFGEGDFTGGLIAGIEEIADGIDRQLGSSNQAAEQDTDEDADPGLATETDAEPLDETSEPAEQSGDASDPVGGGQSPWAIGGGLVGLGACGGVFFLVSRQRRLASARADFERSSAAPIIRVGVLRERDSRLTAQADVWSKTTAGRTLVALRGLLRETDAGRSAAGGASALLTQAIPDGVGGADEASIARAQDRLIELSRALDLQDESLDRLAAFGAHIDHLRVALPAKAELLDEEVDEALEMADQRESEGWSVESQQRDLNGIGDVIDGLDLVRLELDLLALSDQIEAAEARLFATNHYLQALPSRVNSLKKWNAGLEAAADLELRRIEDLRRQFALVAGNHASDSWHWAADYPEQAREELEAAEEMQDVAISEMIARQRLDEAGEQLDAAGLQLMVADDLLDQCDDLLVDLDRAMAESPGIVEQSAEVLGDLISYIEQHRSDLDSDLVAAPRDLASAVDGLRSELRQKKPNYLRVAETGDRINRQIDGLLGEAADQHLRMEALRRELSREVARAQRSVARARRSLGWELFSSSDGRALDGLEASLQHLPTDLPDAIAEAADVADDALRVQERIIARRRRSSVWVTTGGGGWRSGGGGWSSGGSGSSGGSFGGSSSGGRSFGGGSSSGGRSFGGGRSSGSF
ncbi:MAG: hypothetical protein ACRBK7_17935 [Acidimicrobiales bacterium]